MHFLRWRLKKIGRWPPEIAVSSWSFRHEFKRERGLDILGFPRFVKERLGITNLELLINNFPSEDESFFQEVRRSLDAVGAKAVCLAINNDFTLVGEELEREILHASALVRKAAILGVPLVRVNPGFREPGQPAETARGVTSALRQLAEVASQHGVRLAVENQGFFGMRPENMLQVLDAVARPAWVGACVDFGNFFPEDRNSTRAMRLCAWATHVHAKSYAFDAEGNETSIRYLDWIAALKRAGYRGYLSVEYEGPLDTDEMECVGKTIRLIKHCLQQVG